MNITVVRFPGTNCEHDLVVTAKDIFGSTASVISSSERSLPTNTDLLFLPGGFSYGDYLRPGAMAKICPIMKAIREFAGSGGRVVGICNGFQILCEAGLLPGVLLPNKTIKFLSRPVHVRVENIENYVTGALTVGDVIEMPVAHFDGNYFAEPHVLSEIEGNAQVVFRYCSPSGEVSADSSEWNPNGSCNAIAGVCNKERNVVGFMPHPERRIDLQKSKPGCSNHEHIRSLFTG
ncbi:MAG: phosphoribosylformylglycinamidine synthase subunit PurQ, partial [Bdellovibrionales bacterium]|nr:phosphoribosylformylglycinamidine synthase subunit PurQ [Bdellovibrionales bacterium]